MSSHSSWPTGGAGRRRGLGIFGGCGKAYKTFTSDECLDALVTHLTDNPDVIHNQLNLIMDYQFEELRQLKPAVIDPTAWCRTSTHRPTHDDEGNKLLGTDRVVRTFENDTWLDAGHVLEAKVTTEYGEITDFAVLVKW